MPVPDVHDGSTPQPQIGSTTKVAEDPDQTKTTTENTLDVGTAKNTKEEEKDNKNNKTTDKAEKLKALAEDASNTILPPRKVKKLETLGQLGKAAYPYLAKIGNESWSPRVQRKILEIMSDISKQPEESEDS